MNTPNYDLERVHECFNEWQERELEQQGSVYAGEAFHAGYLQGYIDAMNNSENKETK